MKPLARLTRRMSLRLRMVLVTAAAVAFVVAVGGLLIIEAVREEFIDAADWNAEARADQVAALAAAGVLPSRLPAEDDGETAVQVVRDGEVVSRTPNVTGGFPLPLPHQPPGDRQLLAFERLPVAGAGPFRAAALGVDTPQGPATVFVTVSTEDVEDVVATAIRTGSVGLVLLVLPLSALLWMAIGRTLAPVEAIRERADAITGEQLSQRVPEPAQMDEIGRLARTINAMLARLNASADSERRFLADAAHELRSPVASLRAQLETAQRSGHDSTPTDLPDLLADTLRMQQLVDQLLLLARSDAGMVGRLEVAVDLDDTVHGVVESRRAEGRHREVGIDVRRVEAVQVTGDPGLLEQVVRNLVDNAVRYARHTVGVTLTAVDDQAVLTVDDDGPGIPAEERERVFERFTRLDDARHRVEGGVGLGLAIVADIVHAHGGTVVVLDSPTGGARLQVTLPLSPSTNLAAPRA